MALSKLTYNSLNVTAAANKGIGFGSGADDLSTDFSGGSIRFIKKFFTRMLYPSCVGLRRIANELGYCH